MQRNVKTFFLGRCQGGGDLPPVGLPPTPVDVAEHPEAPPGRPPPDGQFPHSDPPTKPHNEPTVTLFCQLKEK